MINIRCSQLPIIVRCQGMLQPGYTAVNPVSAVADAGTDIHKRNAQHVLHGTVPSVDDPEAFLWGRLNEACQKMGVDVYDLIPEGRLFTSMDGRIKLSGRPDYWRDFMGRETAYLIDLKTGWRSGEGGAEDRIALKHVEQLLGYAYLIMSEYLDEWKQIKVAIVPRVGSIQYETWTRDQIMDWADNLVALLKEWDGQFHPGDHCQYCPRRYDCPGLRQMERASVGIVTDEGRLYDLTDPATLADLWQKARIVLNAADQLQKEIRKHLPLLDKNNVPDSLPIWLERTTKRVLDPVEAWPVLAREIGDEGLAQCVTIGLQRLETALKSKAERGEKESYLRGVLRELEACGAIRFEPGPNRVVLNKEN